jgi:hypothetical protein
MEVVFIEGRNLPLVVPAILFRIVVLEPLEVTGQSMGGLHAF